MNARGRKRPREESKEEALDDPSQQYDQTALAESTPVLCKPGFDPDGEYKKATIKLVRFSETRGVEYYLHYKDTDRRLDEWVPPKRITVKGGRNVRANSLKMVTKDEHMARREKAMQDWFTKTDQDPHNDHDRPKNINALHFGKYTMGTWYWSPFPCLMESFPLAKHCSERAPEVRATQAYYDDEEANLWMCEYCLKPFVDSECYTNRHVVNCAARHPPGKNIYYDPECKVSVWEVVGQDEPTYCQNLCLLSKLFLDHKFVKYDTGPFLFYILAEVDDAGGHHLMGYFSKEHDSQDNNVSCILTLPVYQDKGVGRMLIELSYELTRREGRRGSPEKPLSDLGERSYLSYWRDVLMKYLVEGVESKKPIILDEIGNATGIRVDDIHTALVKLNIFAPGKKNTPPRLVVTDEMCAAWAERMKAKEQNYRVRPDLLKWQPPPDSRANGAL